MKTYKVTRKELNVGTLEFNHANTESRIIPITIDGEKMILKKFFVFSQFCLNNKMYIIQELNKYKKQIESVSKNFILPEMIAVDENNKKIGYIMHYIEGRNLETVLNDESIPLRKKIDYLKQMCSYIEYCDNLRKSGIPNFYINDLHVNNFIANNGNLYLCDIDGCRIGTSKHQNSRYIVTSYGISSLNNKYQKLPYNEGYIANKNTDLYCAIMVIMNFLYNGAVHRMCKDDFDKYINYLRSTKICDERLLSVFSRIYENENNINPKPYLDTISEKLLIKANYLQFGTYDVLRNFKKS